MTSSAAAPITVKVTDSAYWLLEGQLLGIPELVEHAGRDAGAVNAVEARVKMLCHYGSHGGTRFGGVMSVLESHRSR